MGNLSASDSSKIFATRDRILIYTPCYCFGAVQRNSITGFGEGNATLVVQKKYANIAFSEPNQRKAKAQNVAMGLAWPDDSRLLY